MSNVKSLTLFLPTGAATRQSLDAVAHAAKQWIKGDSTPIRESLEDLINDAHNASIAKGKKPTKGYVTVAKRGTTQTVPEYKVQLIKEIEHFNGTDALKCYSMALYDLVIDLEHHINGKNKILNEQALATDSQARILTNKKALTAKRKEGAPIVIKPTAAPVMPTLAEILASIPELAAPDIKILKEALGTIEGIAVPEVSEPTVTSIIDAIRADKFTPDDLEKIINVMIPA